MKIQCNVCEVAEATVLCCADEAVLCYGCDDKVHAANKLASKHQRVSLTNSSSPMPKCDICEETVGYFFCLEDRALLCRKCDVSIHSINAHVSDHQRFLLTGVKVGLEPIERSVPASSGKSHSPEKVNETESRPLSKKDDHVALDGQQNNGHIQVAEVDQYTPTKSPFGGGSDCGSFQQWQLDEICGLTELNQNYNYIDNGSSELQLYRQWVIQGVGVDKNCSSLAVADSGKLGESDCSAILLPADLELDGDECLGHVPAKTWDVPDILSPQAPTASGLGWSNNYQHQVEITPSFVPDACYYSTTQDQQMGSSFESNSCADALRTVV